MPFRINVPTVAGTAKLPLVRTGPRDPEPASLFFAVGGQAEPGLRPHFAVLQPSAGGNVVAYANPFRHPGPDQPPPPERGWAMWFDLGEVGDAVLALPLDLVVYRLQGGTQHELGRLTNISFDGPPVIQVIYPTSGTFCPDGITPYGSFSNPDTRILRVELVEQTASGDGQVISDSAPYFTRSGFWTGSFNGVPPGTYRVRAIGDQSTSAASGTIVVQSC